jgi:tetratricopeptide (TPR) repeat protein
LAKELTADAASRFYFFLILFFGPHTILHFGFVGVEPVVVAVSIWFALVAVRLSVHFATKHLLAVWGIVLIGLFMHYSSIYLLPAAVYVTVRGCRRKGNGHAIALATGLGTYVGLLVLAYYWAGQNLEFSKFILFLTGKLPHSDYGIFSTRHMGDLLQIFLLAFPQIIVVAYLVLTHRLSSGNKGGLPLLLPLLLGLGGVTVVLILDPVHNIVLDYPRLTAYLFPLSLVLALLVNEHRNHSRDRLVALLAAVCLIFPLGYLPSYLCIAKADPYVTDYLEKHDSFYLDGCLAFRDAYFYRKELDEANAWEWKLPKKSPDYLNLEGVKALAAQGEEAEALRTLYKIIAKNPYWSEARAVFVSIQMKLGRYALAKPQIDTCLMLEPYRKEYLMNLYRYYRDIQSYPQALKSIKKVLKIFPDDLEPRTDLMIVYYRSGALQTADSLADALLAADSSLPYPYLIKGFIAERHNERQAAIALYKKFVALAPNEPDTPAIQERLNELMWETTEEE